MLFDHRGHLYSCFSRPVSIDQCGALNPDSKKTIISELEALAVLVGARTLCGRLCSQGRDWLVAFIDNEASLHALDLDGIIQTGLASQGPVSASYYCQCEGAIMVILGEVAWWKFGMNTL